ncbi:CHASE2 domain-containing protein [Synechococcus sp. PCC 7336]|uniref:CHASE2 domain-containing protein n=1 Tax=Synechococcus sp. PCC 7336 TaxID=195250 RepID=UPI00034BF947|nr:CHASE2 domain-containing protein [Synechococcus sp. PCC 7336]
MTVPFVAYRLKVQQVERACLFQLSWGVSQQLSAALPYPPKLAEAYEHWRRTYLNFYGQSAIDRPLSPPSSKPPISGVSPNSLPVPPPLVPPPPDPPPEPPDALRGRVVETGSMTPAANDLHARLAKAEATLLHQFHRWLRSSELYEIRSEIARAALRVNRGFAFADEEPRVDVFLTCTPFELERLPWEAWEIGEEFAAANNIRIARYPANVREEPTQLPQRRHNRMRVLAILGDDTGLDFKADREAVERLAPVADVEFIGYQPEQSVTELKQQIAEALDDDRGWDILFFAGHSNETEVTGGELAIAPGAALSIRELTPHLKRARQQGLQFAMFNSCSGLSIANASIDLGLSQVAIVREPIHNQVAQEFLVRLLQNLADGQDSHDALRSASKFLKSEKSLTYPSSYLIPSIFRHPNTELFRIERRSWRQRLQQVLPNRAQAIALGALSLLSLLPGVQNALLEGRTFGQAIYRDLTGQLPETGEPPVLLVQIDRESIFREGIPDPTPMDRGYLAKLVRALSERSAVTVGIDYLLDRQQPDTDPVFAAAVETAIEKCSMWMVLASISDRYPAVEAADIAPLEWTLRGNINGSHTHLKLPPLQGYDGQNLPFGYLLALVWAIEEEPLGADRVEPDLTSEMLLQVQLLSTASAIDAPESPVSHLKRLRSSPITEGSTYFGQRWLHPIIDFSIPPDRVYERMPAWQLLEGPAQLAGDGATDRQQIAIVAPGGYEEAGIGKADYFPLPAAMSYWREKGAAGEIEFEGIGLENAAVYTGAEVHAYNIHHFLNRHLVTPVPDLWLVALSAVGGKTIAVWMEKQQRQSPTRWLAVKLLAIGTGLYALISVQLYISSTVLLPVVLPATTLWTYVLLSWRRTSRD